MTFCSNARLLHRTGLLMSQLSGLYRLLLKMRVIFISGGLRLKESMITIHRHTKTDKQINGTLTLPDGFEIHTLERPDLGNEPFVSCIPEGQYKFKRDYFGKHQWWSILDVPNRTNIEIHEGSKVSHSEGCILMSRESLNKMLEFYDDDKTYVLEII
jgi:hypothetical protein